MLLLFVNCLLFLYSFEECLKCNLRTERSCLRGWEQRNLKGNKREECACDYRVPRYLSRKSLMCLLTGLEDFFGPCYGAEARNGSNIGSIYTNRLRSSDGST